MADTPDTNAPSAQDTLNSATAGAGQTATPVASPTAGSPDNAAGAPQTPPQTPQQPQVASDGSQQTSATSDSSQPQGGAPKPAAAVSAVQPAKAPVPPVVQHASIIHSIAQTLAGGPRTTYAIDPNTGEMKATQQPLSGKSIAQAIAIAALSGGFAGLSEKGPGANARGAAAGFQQVQQQQEQATAQQKQQASQDYARQAAITQTNFQTHQNALRMSQMEYDYHKQLTSDTEPVLKNINAVGATLESGVHESDLMSKYHVTKDMAIPDGTVENGKNPDGSTHWENTYTVIDPSKKIELPEETAKILADLRIPGYFTMKDGKAVPQDFSGSAGIRAGLVVNGLATAQGFQITESQMNKQFAGLKGGDKDAAQFDVNLKKSIASGDVTLKGLQTIGNYAGLPLDQAVEAMRKDKVDPSIISQFERVVPADAMEQIKQKRIADEATAKAGEARTNLVVGKNNYDEVLADSKAFSPEQVAAAHSVDKQIRQEKSRDDYNSGVNHRQGEIDVDKKNGIPLPGSKTASKSDAESNLTHPELASLVQDQSNYNTPTGVNQKFLDGLMKIDPERAKMIEAYSKGMDIQSYYAAVKQFGGSINADIHAYDPSFNASNMRRYDKTISEWGAGGKLGKTNAAASTAIEHLGKLYDAYGIGSAAGLSGEYDTSLNQASTELSTMYANGLKPGEEEIKHNRVALDHPTLAFKGRAATVQAAKEAYDKIEENFNQYDKDLPGGIQREPPLSVKAAKAYEHLTGEKVDPKLVNQNLQTRIGSDGKRIQGSTQNANNPAPAKPSLPSGTTHLQPMSDGKSYPVDAQGNILGPPQ